MKIARKLKKGKHKVPKSGRKRPLSAYMLFTQAVRGRVKSEHPEASITDLAKLMGEEWRAMGETDKAGYQSKAKELKDAYDAAVAAEAGPGASSALAGKRKRDNEKGVSSTKKRKKASAASESAASVELVKVHPNGLREMSDGRILDDEGELHFASEVDAKPRIETTPDLSKFDMEAGVKAVLVLPAVEEFLEAAKGVAKEGTLACVSAAEVESFPSLASNGMLDATCTAIKDCGDGSWKQATFEIASSGAEAEASAGQAASGAGSHTTKTITLPWLSAQDDSMSFVPYVLTQAAFEDSVKEDVRPGSQISADFIEASSGSEEKWVMYEGRVYHVGSCSDGVCKKYKNCPYKSLSVVWYYQSISKDCWVLDEQQLDNLMSPWDVRLSSEFVRRPNVHAYADVPIPTLGAADQVIAYMRRCEFGQYFWDDPTKGDDDYAARIKHPMCLRTMIRKHRKGEYDGSKISKLWEDLLLVVKNTRKYYDGNRVEYRMADMLYREVRSIKKAFKPGQGSIKVAKAAVPRVNPWVKVGSEGGKPRRRAASGYGSDEDAPRRRRSKKIKEAAEAPPTVLRSKRGSAAQAALRMRAKALQDQGLTEEEASASTSLKAAEEDQPAPSQAASASSSSSSAAAAGSQPDG